MRKEGARQQARKGSRAGRNAARHRHLRGAARCQAGQHPLDGGQGAFWVPFEAQLVKLTQVDVQGAGQLEGQMAPAAAGALRPAPAWQDGGGGRWWRRAGWAVAAGAVALLADLWT